MASNISYRPLIQADVTIDVFADLLPIMNELKHFTNDEIGKIGKLVHKQNLSFYFIIIVQVGLHLSRNAEKETGYIQCACVLYSMIFK